MQRIEARTRFSAHAIAALLCLAITFAAPHASYAEGASDYKERLSSYAERVFRGVEVTFDLVVVRPLNLAGLAVGSAAFVLTSPLVFPHEGLATSWDVFVYAPYEYIFRRPLGDL